MGTLPVAALLLSAALLASCGKAPADAASTEASPASWVLTSEPAGAVSVTHARAQAKEGDEVVIIGRIGGRRQALSAASSAFLIIDPALPSCADEPQDTCPTPWDYCCETPETIMGNSATVQIVGAGAGPIEADPIAAGLEPLDTVVVKGTVAARPNADVLTILASGIYKRSD